MKTKKLKWDRSYLNRYNNDMGWILMQRCKECDLFVEMNLDPDLDMDLDLNLNLNLEPGTWNLESGNLEAELNSPTTVGLEALESTGEHWRAPP